MPQLILSKDKIQCRKPLLSPPSLYISRIGRSNGNDRIYCYDLFFLFRFQVWRLRQCWRKASNGVGALRRQTKNDDSRALRDRVKRERD